MGNQTHRINRQGNLGQQANNRPVPVNQLKCPRCQIILPAGTTIQNVFICFIVLQFAEHIRGCLQAHNNHNMPSELANHPIIAQNKPSDNYENIQYEKVLSI